METVVHLPRYASLPWEAAYDYMENVMILF